MRQIARTTTTLMALVGMLAFAGGAMGNSLSVTSAAAMGGTAQGTCIGDGMPGPCGLEVFHDNTSLSYVEDQSPSSETIYRATFLFNPNSISPGANLRQRLFRAIGPNPFPGNGNCSPVAKFSSVLEVWLFLVGGAGQKYALQVYGEGNLCGYRSTAQFEIAPDQPVRVCMEWSAGNSGTGTVALAVVDAALPCPASSSYSRTALSNGLTTIDTIRLGIPTLNNFNAGESGSLYFDEFESFRTLAP